MTSEQNPAGGVAVRVEADVVRDALALYEPPFTFDHGYIYDAKDRMVMDAHRNRDGEGRGTIELRVRGWGRIGYMPNGAELQDAVGAQIAEALTAHWLAHNDQAQARAGRSDEGAKASH